MKTVFNDTDRRAIYERQGGLTLERTPLWGRMTSGQMLTHLTDSVRMTLGELAVQPKRGPLRLGLIRHAVIHWLPFPKGAPTAPELLLRCAEDCAVEIAELKAAMERMASKAGTRTWEEHPAFGRMTEHDWGVLVYRHTDHHLRQFGV
jgi:hypothetical protein